MLLAIDTGNTNTLFAIHDGKDWVVEWRIATNATRTADEYAVWFHQLMEMQGFKFSDIEACVISTVVPQSLFNMRNLARRHLNVDPIIIGEDGVEIGIGIRNVNPKEVGADRLVTALGATKHADALAEDATQGKHHCCQHLGSVSEPIAHVVVGAVDFLLVVDLYEPLRDEESGEYGAYAPLHVGEITVQCEECAGDANKSNTADFRGNNRAGDCPPWQ